MMLSESYRKRIQELAGVKSTIITEIDRKKMIIDKLGLSSEVADWAIGIHPKLSIWIADKVKKDASLYPRAESDFRLIADWFRSGEAGDIKKLSFEKALEKAHQAHEKFIPIDKSLKNFDVALDLGDYKWVQLTKPWHCTEEGEAMGHCIGAEDYGHPQGIASGKLLAYSLRDKFNKPHITIEINKNTGEVIEFKGKQNKMPEAKYMPYAIEFLKENKEWDYITDRMFWNNLFENKKLALQFYKKIPSLFDIRKKLIIGAPLSKKELNVKGDLDLSYTLTEKLPDGLTVEGDLNLYNISIETLPNNLTVSGYLNLGDTIIKKLPDSLSVGEDLILNGTAIETLPDNLTVSGGLDLSFTPIKKLPNNLTVNGYLDLENTSIKELPDNLTVGRSLSLSNTPIKELPNNLKVGRDLYLNNTPFSKNKTKKEIRKMVKHIGGGIYL